MDWFKVGLVVFSCVWGLFTTYFFYMKKKEDDQKKREDEAFERFKQDNNVNISAVSKNVSELSGELKLVTQKQIEHEFNFVTEKHVREILKEEVKDIKADISTVKGNVSTILDSLQNLNIAIGIQNGLREKEMQRQFVERNQ